MLFPYELLLRGDGLAERVRSGLATGDGNAAPTARSLQWSAKNVSVGGQKQFQLRVPVVMSDAALIRFSFSTLRGNIVCTKPSALLLQCARD